MDCKEFNDKISLYLDDKLKEEEKKSFEKHLSECSECEVKYKNTKNIVETVNDIPLENLPDKYCQALHNKLKEKSSKKKTNYKKIIAIAAAFIILLGATFVFSNLGILRGGNFDMGFKSQDEAAESPRAGNMDTSYDMESIEEESGGEVFNQAASPENFEADDGNKEKSLPSEAGYRDRELKIIKTADLHIETLDYDDYTQKIKAKLSEVKGYIQYMETYSDDYFYDKNNNQIKLKNGRFTIRVPKDKFQSVFDYLKGQGELIQESINEIDLTKDYYEIDNKVNNLETQEERLRELMDKAVNITELMQIENELTRIRSQIDNLKMNLSDIDDKSDMSTINLYISEVKDETKIQIVDKNTWTRALENLTKTINGIIKFAEDSFVFFIGFIPMLIIYLVIGFILWKIIKKIFLNKK